MPAIYTLVLAIVFAIGMAFALVIFLRSARHLPLAYDLIYAAMDEVVLVLDPKHLILSANPSAERLLGQSNAELLNRAITDFIPDDQGFSSHDEDAKTFDCILNTGTPCRGQSLPLIRAGVRVGWLLVLRDVTLQRQAEQRLRESEAKATALAYQRTQRLTHFIQATSHEFRTSVTLIKASAHQLSQLDSPDQSAQPLEQIALQTAQLTHLMNRAMSPSEDSRLP